MFSPQRRVVYVLMNPFHPDGTVLIVRAITYFGFVHIHIAVVPGQFMIAVKVIVEIGMRADTGLLCGVIPVFDAVTRFPRLIIKFAFFAAIGI